MGLCVTTCFRDGPLLVVASGRDTISVASSIKRLAPENVFVIQVKLHPFSFHLIVCELPFTWHRYN
ncbi:hypothetical protein Patl1_32607 [Pistacia atlantica]|uniref:Uncharacterized protein n=1 Tax=Pistacia atlantica TaxID=434234 RepID=A0ACC1AMU7_9ROSI|nr:hypothetical protein Patl1_32607 [Pistacia atlantica]